MECLLLPYMPLLSDHQECDLPVLQRSFFVLPAAAWQYFWGNDTWYTPPLCENLGFIKYLCFKILWRHIIEIDSVAKKSKENTFANSSMAGLASSCVLRGISGQHKFNAGNKFVCDANVIYKSIHVCRQWGQFTQISARNLGNEQSPLLGVFIALPSQKRVPGPGHAPAGVWVSLPAPPSGLRLTVQMSFLTFITALLTWHRRSSEINSGQKFVFVPPPMISLFVYEHD